MRRCFFAVPLTGYVVQRIVAAASRIQYCLPEQVEFWDEAQPHLTLRFLGDLEDQWIIRMMETANCLNGSLILPPFSLYLTGEVGYFPDESGAKVVYAGVGGDLVALERAHHYVDQLALRYGLPPANPPFHPHITIGCFPNLDPRDIAKTVAALGQAQKQIWRRGVPYQWKIGAALLMEMVRLNGAERYRIVSLPELRIEGKST